MKFGFTLVVAFILFQPALVQNTIAKVEHVGLLTSDQFAEGVSCAAHDMGDKGAVMAGVQERFEQEKAIH